MKQEIFFLQIIEEFLVCGEWLSGENLGPKRVRVCSPRVLSSLQIKKIDIHRNFFNQIIVVFLFKVCLNIQILNLMKNYKIKKTIHALFRNSCISLLVTVCICSKLSSLKLQ